MVRAPERAQALNVPGCSSWLWMLAPLQGALVAFAATFAEGAREGAQGVTLLALWLYAPAGAGAPLPDIFAAARNGP